MNTKPTILDAFFLSCFAILITFQPYLFHHEIIMMETGIHLPGIMALLDGAVPYRDFLYFRGPLELYVPAYMMKFFGMNMIWLPVFYYVGTVLTLLTFIVLGLQLFRTRFILYLMVPVMVARTFPRISYYYWGGLRYFLGALSLVLAVQSYRSKKAGWMFAAGAVSCLAFWTTIEAGVCTVFAIGGSLLVAYAMRAEGRQLIRELLQSYIIGFFIVFLPVVIYMSVNGSLLPYLETTFVVLTRSFKTFPNGPGLHPVGINGFLNAMVPGAEFFQSMTPVYFYIVLGLYLLFRNTKKTFNAQACALTCVAFYGIALYVTGFRRLDGHHFEMALQPEKVLLFYILESFYLNVLLERLRESNQGHYSQANALQYLWSRKKKFIVNFLIIAFIGSSLGYAFTRYSRRFVAFQQLVNGFTGRSGEDMSFLKDVEKRPVNIERARGMVVPVWQAEEMEGIVGFLQAHTGPDEAVFTFPELGNFNFWADRPFVGRFPIVTFSWMLPSWTKGLKDDFQKAAPSYVIMTNPGHRTFPEEWYFRNKTNIAKFNDMTAMIHEDYSPLKQYESVTLYRRNP